VVSAVAAAGEEQFRPRLLDERIDADRELLAELRADPVVTVLDHRDAQRTDLQRIIPAPDSALLYHPGCWAYYPWRRTVVGVLGQAAFRLLRLDRNRNKITRAEQDKLGQLSIG